MDLFRKVFPGEFYKKFLAQGIRPDGRPLNKLRKTTISTGSISSAYGSAFVTLGNTSILCGIGAEVGQVPPPDVNINISDSQHLVVNMDVSSLCSPHIPSGKSSEYAQYVAQKLNELCYNLLDTSNLHSEPNENRQTASWFLYADLYCFNCDGNIMDCATIALLAALSNVALPIIQLDPHGDIHLINSGQERPIQLILNHFPIATSFCIVEDKFLVDPNMEEEGIFSSVITIVYDEKGHLCLLTQQGPTSMPDEQFQNIIEQSKHRSLQILELIKRNKTQSSLTK